MKIKLTVRERIIRALKKNGAMTAKRLASRYKLNYNTVRKVLGSVKDFYIADVRDGRSLYSARSRMVKPWRPSTSAPTRKRITRRDATRLPISDW